MLKDEWLVKQCNEDVITLLRFLDVETYESVGESVMAVLLKDGSLRVQDGQGIRQYITAIGENEGTTEENHGLSYLWFSLAYFSKYEFLLMSNAIYSSEK